MAYHDCRELLETLGAIECCCGTHSPPGATAVFPEMVAEVKEGLTLVTTMLRANKTAQATQQRQADVEDMLKLLIDALRKTIETKENGGQCGH